MKPDSKESSLLNYRRNVTSQFGEDGILERVFEVLGTPAQPWCVECGAWDGIEMSNTWNLIAHHGWSSVLIEGDEELAGRLLQTYGRHDRVICIKEYLSREVTLESVFARTPLPQNFDFFSLDIDGSEYWAWKSLLRYRPRVVLMEVNPSFGPAYPFVPKPGVLGFGTSPRSMIELAAEKGYELAVVTDVNCLFVVREEFAKLGIGNNSCQSMYDALWPGGDNPWVPQMASDYDGNHYLIRPGQWNERKVRSFLPDDKLRDASAVGASAAADQATHLQSLLAKLNDELTKENWPQVVALATVLSTSVGELAGSDSEYTKNIFKVLALAYSKLGNVAGANAARARAE